MARLPAVPLVLALAIPAARVSATDFERDVAPILMRRCLECHGGTDAAGGLDLTSNRGLLTGGKGGAAVVAGKPDDSHLLARVAASEMPPPKQGEPKPRPKEDTQAPRAWRPGATP